MTGIEVKSDPFKEVMQAVSDLRTEVEKKSADHGKIENIEKLLATQEEANQKNVNALAAEQKARTELEEKHKQLETEMQNLAKGAARGAAGDEALASKAAEIKSFERFVTTGSIELSAEERKYLRTNDDTQGGYLVPYDMVKEIIKNITEISPIRAWARIRPTTSKIVEIPKRTSLLTASWVGEGETDAQSQSAYGMEVIPVHKMQVSVPVTHEMLRDSAFNVESEIFEDVRLAFAATEGLGFLSGNGFKKPQGILADTRLTYTATGTSGAVTADSIILMAGEIKTGYNLAYMLNRKTLATVRTLKASDGHYLWVPGIANGTASVNTLNGLPYAEVPDMPDIAASSYPILLGDLMRGYTIVDNLNLESIRDDYSLKREGKVEFTFYKRTGGQVVLPEAFRLLKASVS